MSNTARLNSGAIKTDMVIEMTKELEARFVPWTWIVACVVTIVMMGMGYFVTDTRSTITTQQALISDLREKKADRQEVVNAVNSLSVKIDDLYKLQINYIAKKSRGLQ